MSNRTGRDTSVQSVERAIAILDLLAHGRARTGAEVSRDLDVHRSTALRLLATLERGGLVQREPGTSRYRLGPRLAQLAGAVSGEVDLRIAARPVCERLARDSGETATLDVLSGDDIVPIEQATGSTSVMTVNWLGRHTPVHCTASGKVILAFLPKAERQRLLMRPLAAATAHTITDLVELEGQLDAAREAGIARTHEELELGLDAIAAPVFGPDGLVLAAVDVSGPSQRLRARSAGQLDELTKQGAEALSRRLGYRPRNP